MVREVRAGHLMDGRHAPCISQGGIPDCPYRRLIERAQATEGDRMTIRGVDLMAE